MKTDRLLGIIIYLLNHKKVNAKTLSKKYEVSIRTIRRDMDSLCMAGIPIISTYGSDGGYEIAESFQMERQLAGKDDYTYIISALSGFLSAYRNHNLEETLEKIRAVSTSKKKENIILDFGVLREQQNVNQYITKLEKAITSKQIVNFKYTSSSGSCKEQQVEPISVVYKWYSWYLLGYCVDKEDYRLYKLIRMENLYETNQSQRKEHPLPEEIMKKQEQNDVRRHLEIKLQCNATARMKVLEYLNGIEEQELEDGSYLMRLHVPEGEHFWLATLIALGNSVTILEPMEVKESLKNKCMEILEIYKDV
jgi:predicted DNA-binding transcriptional regulator YafY